MYTELFDRLRRVVIVVAAFGLSAMLIWRGHHFVEPGGTPTLLVPAMCTLTAIVVALTGLSMALRSGETDAAY